MPVYMIILLVPMLNILLHMCIFSLYLYKTKPSCQLDTRVIAAVSDLKYISLNLNFLINGIEVQHVWYHCTLIYLVCLVGLKPTTHSLEGYCSILLSYRHIMLLSGFEPPTLCLGGRRSILLSYNSMSTDHILMICDIIPNATVILKVFILKKIDGGQ